VSDRSNLVQRGPDGYTLIRALAYRGKEGCENVVCTRLHWDEVGRSCYGWHCATCDEPCSSQGHNCPQLRGDEQA